MQNWANELDSVSKGIQYYLQTNIMIMQFIHLLKINGKKLHQVIIVDLVN